jgi:hypothetical protein
LAFWRLAWRCFIRARGAFRNARKTSRIGNARANLKSILPAAR